MRTNQIAHRALRSAAPRAPLFFHRKVFDFLGRAQERLLHFQQALTLLFG
jgi:hypothetical protein